MREGNETLTFHGTWKKGVRDGTFVEDAWKRKTTMFSIGYDLKRALVQYKDGYRQANTEQSLPPKIPTGDAASAGAVRAAVAAAKAHNARTETLEEAGQVRECRVRVCVCACVWCRILCVNVFAYPFARMY